MAQKKARNPEELRQKAHILSNEGARLLAAGKPAEAIPILQRARELAPDAIGAAINLAGAYILAGKQRLAAPILEEACRLEPGNVMLWTNLGAAYLDRPPYVTPEGQVKAIQAFERALSLDPAAPHVSYNLGLICKDRDELERAQEHFRNALRANPADRDAARWIEALQTELDRRAGADAEPPAGT